MHVLFLLKTEKVFQLLMLKGGLSGRMTRQFLNALKLFSS